MMGTEHIPWPFFKVLYCQKLLETQIKKIPCYLRGFKSIVSVYLFVTLQIIFQEYGAEEATLTNRLCG